MVKVREKNNLFGTLTVTARRSFGEHRRYFMTVMHVNTKSCYVMNEFASVLNSMFFSMHFQMFETNVVWHSKPKTDFL